MTTHQFTAWRPAPGSRQQIIFFLSNHRGVKFKGDFEAPLSESEYSSNDWNGFNDWNKWNELPPYFSTASANFAPGNQELLHLSSVKF